MQLEQSPDLLTVPVNFRRTKRVLPGARFRGFQLRLRKQAFRYARQLEEFALIRLRAVDRRDSMLHFLVQRGGCG